MTQVITKSTEVVEILVFVSIQCTDFTATVMACPTGSYSKVLMQGLLHVIDIYKTRVYIYLNIL